MILSADSSSLVSDAYVRAQQAQAAADRKAGTMESITALEEKLTPYIKNIALAGVALVVTIAILRAGKKTRKNPCGGPRMNTKGHNFKSFKDPWAVMSTEDRKKANQLFRSAMKAFSGSPKQKRFHDELMVILNKYNIGKGN